MTKKFRTAIKPGSHRDLMIGPGVIYKNFDLTQFDPDDESTFGILLGVTAGGNNLSCSFDIHTANVDGVLGAVQGYSWIVGASAKLSTSLLSITLENLMLKLPGFHVSTHNEQYDMLSHNGEIEVTTVQNVAIVGEIVGKNIPVIFVMEQARVVDAFELPLGTGKDDVVLKMEFEAEYSEENPTKIPFYILYPKGNSPITQPTVSPAAGTYTGQQSVTIAAQSGARIFYTLDGSIPTPSSGIEYLGAPVSVTETTTIKVIAVKGADISSIASYAYIIN